MKKAITVMVEEKTVVRCDRLAKRMGRSRSAVVEVLLSESLSNQRLAEYLVGGPKNFDRLVEVLRWAVGGGECEDRDVEIIRAVVS
jgi:hypothetical protein